jgi:aspartate ammonia-lyase
MSQDFRKEYDQLGNVEIAKEILFGIHTYRAIENFPVTARKVHAEIIAAYAEVKLACIGTLHDLGYWADDLTKVEAMTQACHEMAHGRLIEHIRVDLLQGGAGTSTNMNVNEVLANRALEILSLEHGNYDRVSPLDDINLFQSTNDTYPTALKLAAIRLLGVLEQNVINLQESFQAKEKEFAHIVKIGRTQLQDAVLTTLGREMGAYAEALSRDRWRIYKCNERLRVINLGGTAIGTGLAAPTEYIFRVAETLRNNTGIGFARAENLLENTQNADVFVEVSGILKALATTLIKICTDLRLMSSGPNAGFGEIRLPARQAGSSIMPGKINPVIPEAVTQAAMLSMGNDQVIAQAAANGNFELNAFLPLIAACLLDNIKMLSSSCDILNRLCIKEIQADEQRCNSYVENSTAAVTALVSIIGYKKALEIAIQSQKENKTIRQLVTEHKIMSENEFEELISPESVNQLGFRKKTKHHE